MRAAILGSVVFTAISAPSLAASKAPEKLTLDIRGLPIREAGTRIGRVQVDKEVPDVRVWVVLKDVSPDHALNVLVRNAQTESPRISYETTDAGFRIFLKERLEEVPELPEEEGPIRFKVKPRREAPSELVEQSREDAPYYEPLADPQPPLPLGLGRPQFSLGAAMPRRRRGVSFTLPKGAKLVGIGPAFYKQGVMTNYGRIEAGISRQEARRGRRTRNPSTGGTTSGGGGGYGRRPL